MHMSPRSYLRNLCRLANSPKPFCKGVPSGVPGFGRLGEYTTGRRSEVSIVQVFLSWYNWARGRTVPSGWDQRVLSTICNQKFTGHMAMKGKLNRNCLKVVISRMTDWRLGCTTRTVRSFESLAWGHNIAFSKVNRNPDKQPIPVGQTFAYTPY